jgi:16S rRNA (cytidine1402-2'-O)-methyltransferase
VLVGSENPGTLWIVATPIGSIGDLSPRAADVLSAVDLILAEDTRRAKRLLSHLGVSTRRRLRSLHEHNEVQQVPSLVEMIAGGRSIAIVSDAGTPVLSDPGFPLVRAARKAGIRVCSVPGASAFTAALAAAGQPPLPATLCGFLPARAGPRRRRIAELAAAPWTLVILLSPHRIAPELADLADILGSGRKATLLAELSKLHERAVAATLGELSESAEAGAPRGEYVLVVGPVSDEKGNTPAISKRAARIEYRCALDAGMDRREALRTTARRLGISRRQAFELVGDDRDPDSS